MPPKIVKTEINILMVSMISYIFTHNIYILYSSCNIGTSGLPDMYTQCLRTAGPKAEGGHIRQTTSAHVATVMHHSPKRWKV